MSKKKKNLKFRATALRKEDEVIVISGKEKGKRGKIMFIDRANERVIVQGVNKIKRFNRPTQENPQGGVIELESGLPLSNVMFYDAKLKKGVRLGIDFIDGKKARVTRTKERKEV